MNQEESYEAYKEEVAGEFATDELIDEARMRYPEYCTVDYGNMVTGHDLYVRFKEELITEASGDNWSSVVGRAEDLEDFEYNTDSVYFDGDSDLDEEPLMMEDILQ